MRMRTLGGTGIKVSPYCLGAMMFGAWGNPDHEDSIRIIHAALDGGINASVTLDDAVLDRIDQIVPPGGTSTRPTRGGSRPRSPIRPSAAARRPPAPSPRRLTIAS